MFQRLLVVLTVFFTMPISMILVLRTVQQLSEQATSTPVQVQVLILLVYLYVHFRI